jgi:hypothetical protein
LSATNRTFGELRFQLQREFNGLDADTLDFWLTERYRDVLNDLPWQRLRVQSVIQAPAKYDTGTVAVTNGANSVTLTGGTWSSAMTGRMIRFNGENEYYQFTFASSTTGTLDRTYEGSDNAAATYKISQSVFVLPADCRQLHSIRVLGAPRDLDKISQEQLDEAAPHRSRYGTPVTYALHMDNASSPSRRQVELYPIPDELTPLPYWYTQDPTLFSASDTGSFFAPWLLPNAIVDHVRSMAYDDLGRSDRAARRAETALQQMRTNEARQRGSEPLRMAPAYTRHRVERVVGRLPGGNFVLGDDFS